MASNDNARPVVVDRPEESARYIVKGAEVRRERDGRIELLTGVERERAARWLLRETGRTSVVTGARAAG